MQWSLSEATRSDIGEIRVLIERSSYELQRDAYSPEQIRAALGPVFGVDEQMIRDRTYFVARTEGRVVGCGGWSFREAMFEGRSAGEAKSGRLDSERDAARIRAFFVDPDFSRQGIGSSILERCEEELVGQGFQRAEISSTLIGVRLYEAFGYSTEAYYEIPLRGAAPLPVARMSKRFVSDL